MAKARKGGEKMVALNARINSDTFRRLGAAKYGIGKSIQEITQIALENFLRECGYGPEQHPPAEPPAKRPRK